MKMHLPSVFFTLLAVVFVTGCDKTPSGTPPAQTPPPRIRAAIPTDHTFEFESGFSAHDLGHGNGALQLSVTRQWKGTETMDACFGRGWADQNVIRLTLVSENILILWRGGVGSNIAHRNGDNAFEGDAGETFQKTDAGWTAKMPHGLTLTFDIAGRLTTEQGAAGQAKTYTYDKNGRMVTVGTGPENQFRYSYDKAGRYITHVDGPEGLALDYAYDDKGRLLSVTNAKKVRIEYRYADDGSLVSAKDQFGNQLELAGIRAVREPAGKATARLSAVPDFAKTKYQFDAQGRTTSASEGGASRNYEYDEAGRVSAISSPEGRTTCKYDAFGRIASMQNAGGTSVRFEYNNLDLPTLIAKSDGTAEKRRYDAHGLLLRRERSPDDWEELAYDSAGRTVSRKTPPAAEVRYFYDNADNTVGIQYSDGLTISLEYGPSGKLISESKSSGEKRIWRYDSDGRLAESVSPAGLVTTYTYDALGRLAANEDRIHGKTTHRPFNGGMILETARGRTITTTTKWGKPLTVVESGGTRTVFNYDEKGRLHSLLSPMNLPWRYEYNATNSLTSIIAPSGLRTSTGWDIQGRETKVARGSVVWREFQYNSAGRIEQEYSGTGRAMRCAYDRDGRLSGIELPDGKVAYTTKQGGLQSIRKGPGYNVEETYSGDGILTRRQYQPAGLDLKLPLDSAGRSAGIELNALKATYSYDGRGQLSQIALPGGAAIKVTVDEAGRAAEFTFGSVVEKITYDRADRIAVIEAATPATRVFSERYDYDRAGNLAQRITDSAEPVKFEYDAESRLTRASGDKSQQAFSYDADGNLTTNGAGSLRSQIDSLGRPAQQGPTSYSWDAGGNLVGVSDAKLRFDNVFDTAGRLVERRAGRNLWNFGYLDGTDRLWKQSAAGKCWYAYAGDRLAGLKDEAGVTWLLVCFPGTDRPLAVCGSNGQTLFILHDRLGSARRFVDASGAVVARDDYAPFGAVEFSEGNAPVRLFAGILRDETGLMYARQRYYDPAIARFISLDPLIGTPGVPPSHNAYAYAANNPLRFRDPLGTSFEFDVQYNWYNPSQVQPKYDELTRAEKEATRLAYDRREAARNVIQNPASTPNEVRAANQSFASHDAELDRLSEIGKLRYQHKIATVAKLDDFHGKGAYSDAGAKANQQMIDNADQKLRNMGVDPLGHYSDGGRQRILNLQAADTAAAEDAAANAADAAARDARAASGFASKNTTAAVPKVDLAGDPPPGANTTRPVNAPPLDGTTGTAAKGDLPVPKNGPTAPDEQTLGKTTGTSTTGTVSKNGPTGPDAQTLGKTSATSTTSTVAGEGGTAGGAKFDPKTGGFKPGVPSGGISSFASAEGAGQRWLGPKILDGVGKVLRAAEPILGPAMTVLEIKDAAQAGAWLAQNFIDTLNQPFMNAQKDKDAAAWVAQRLANELRQLAAADPGAVITPDGHQFDPNNPQDLWDLMLGLSQNLTFKRKPFDGLLTHVTNKPTSFMGPAKGDTAAKFTLENAWKLMKTAVELKKAIGEATKDCIREQEEAKSQLENAMTIAGARAMAEGDLATLPETARGVKAQAAAVREQMKVLQAAFDEMKAAGVGCENAATVVCNLASQSGTATPDQIKAWRAQASGALFTASDALNVAQAKLDSVDVAVDELGTSIAVLEGFRTSLMIFKGASGVVNGAGITPEAALAAAKTAAANASKAREKIGPLTEQLMAIPPQIAAMLAPYVANDAEAAALDAEAGKLAEGIEPPPLVDIGAMITVAAPVIEAALASQKNVENLIGNVDLDAIIRDAQEARTAADALRTPAKALATGPERYQALQRASECYARLAAATGVVAVAKTDDKPGDMPPLVPPKKEDGDVAVPDLSVFSESGEMKAALGGAGLKPGFGMSKNDPPKGKEFKWFAGQSPAPNTIVKKGSTVVIFAYQPPPDSKDQPPVGDPLPGEEPTKPGTMPKLTGLTIDQATTRLTDKMTIGGDEVGDKPDKPEQAYTIYAQHPAPGADISKLQKVVVTVKRFGSAKADAGPSMTGDPFVGTWEAIGARLDGVEVTPKGGSPDPTVKASVLEVSHEPGGYLAKGIGPVDDKGKSEDLHKGLVENGRLVFKVDIDLAKVVGMSIGSTNLLESKANPEDTTMRLRWTLTPVGDNLEMEFLMFEAGSKVSNKKISVTYRRR